MLDPSNHSQQVLREKLGRARLAASEEYRRNKGNPLKRFSVRPNRRSFAPYIFRTNSPRASARVARGFLSRTLPANLQGAVPTAYSPGRYFTVSARMGLRSCQYDSIGSFAVTRRFIGKGKRIRGSIGRRRFIVQGRTRCGDRRTI